MTVPDDSTHQTLHALLRCVASGEVTRTRTPTGDWLTRVNGHRVDDLEIQLAASVLKEQGLIRWWPDPYPIQKAALTLDAGDGFGTLRDWDHDALLDGRGTELDGCDSLAGDAA